MIDKTLAPVCHQVAYQGVSTGLVSKIAFFEHHDGIRLLIGRTRVCSPRQLITTVSSSLLDISIINSIIARCNKYTHIEHELLKLSMKQTLVGVGY